MKRFRKAPIGASSSDVPVGRMSPPEPVGGTGLVFTVAIDGPAAAGKGTISSAVAARFGFEHLDTGLLYRAVARRVLNGESPGAAVRALGVGELDGKILRTPKIAQEASRIAALPEVRAALVEFQRDVARRDGGAVLDGRDIGTAICPDADVKLFVTARPEVRAERRYLELVGNGMDVTRNQVLRDVRERDARDTERAEAPLKPARDAVPIDTSDMDTEQAATEAIRRVELVLDR